MKEGAIVKPVALPGSDGEHGLQEKWNTTPRAHAFYRHQVLDYLNPSMQAFVIKQEMMFVGTADGHGEADTSFRAGLAGFIRLLDEKTLAYPEYRGQRRSCPTTQVLESRRRPGWCYPAARVGKNTDKAILPWRPSCGRASGNGHSWRRASFR